ncbi:hypothetical protein INR49_012425 [Caranx melampygus]|nr:hypothetical protein INR49_012425 [Caranx melampygus]
MPEPDLRAATEKCWLNNYMTDSAYQIEGQLLFQAGHKHMSGLRKAKRHHVVASDRHSGATWRRTVSLRLCPGYCPR